MDSKNRFLNYVTLPVSLLRREFMGQYQSEYEAWYAILHFAVVTKAKTRDGDIDTLPQRIATMARDMNVCIPEIPVAVADYESVAAYVEHADGELIAHKGKRSRFARIRVEHVCRVLFCGITDNAELLRVFTAIRAALGKERAKPVANKMIHALAAGYNCYADYKALCTDHAGELSPSQVRRRVDKLIQYPKTWGLVRAAAMYPGKKRYRHLWYSTCMRQADLIKYVGEYMALKTEPLDAGSGELAASVAGDYAGKLRKAKREILELHTQTDAYEYDTAQHGKVEAMPGKVSTDPASTNDQEYQVNVRGKRLALVLRESAGEKLPNETAVKIHGREYVTANPVKANELICALRDQCHVKAELV